MSEFQMSIEDLISEFYHDVTESVGTTLTRGVSQFQNELTLLARNKKLSQVRTDDVEMACNRLETLLATQFQKNIAKFKLYCDRNIFVPRMSELEAKENQTGNVLRSDAEASLQAVSDDVSGLKARYVSQLQEYRRLSAECNDNSLLLKDMRDALFNLKLASSSDDEFLLRSSASALMDLHRSLHNITDNASALLYEIQTTVSHASDSNLVAGGAGGGGGASSSHDINVKGAFDINVLHMALK